MDIGKKLTVKTTYKPSTRDRNLPPKISEIAYEYTPETMLIIACKMGNYDEVKRLISIGVDPSFDNNKPLERACENGRDEIAKYLLQYPGVSFVDNSALDLAQQYKHSRCIALAPTQIT
jgi:ankyrin repeat protein